MKRALMFTTAYELIICITPYATGSELALSGKNRRPFHPRSHGVQAGFTMRNTTRRNFLFFSQSERKRYWGQVRDNTTHLSSYMKSSVSRSY